MFIHADTCIKSLVNKLIDDILSKNNFYGTDVTKGSFLTGGSVIICESRGLQEYIQKTCADKYGIWTALSFKPLAGLLMQCAYNLSIDKKNERDNIFNQHNLIWAIYRLLEGEKKTFFFSNKLASMFFTYQIYRPELINNWNNGKRYIIPDADNNILNNEKFQRELWIQLKKEYKNERDITQLYELILKSEKKVLPKQVFIFSPISIAPVQLKALESLSEAGCRINLYLHQISCEYIGETKNDKSIANLRKKAWENDIIADDNKLYWDLGNRLIANLGRAAQVLYEQIGWENLEYKNIADQNNANTLLRKVQKNIINDNNEKIECKIDSSLTINNCFSPLREIEVLSDYLLGLFSENKDLTPADIAIVSPNIENYANAIESVFGRYGIPFAIADRDVKKRDKTVQLLNMLFSLIGSRYEAPDVVALFEYSLIVQDKKLDSRKLELLIKWVKENAIRHGLNCQKKVPNYSFNTGLQQLTAGFFMISENFFTENNDYCYPDIEGNSTEVLGDFICFVNSLKELEEKCNEARTVEDWDDSFKECLKSFFGADETDFTEEDLNPYQKVINAWDLLKKEILIGFGNKKDELIDFSVLKLALPKKLEDNAGSSYYLSGKILCSNIETTRAIPYKVICCIGMNNKEFPRQSIHNDISLMSTYKKGDKDIANEDRLIFLESIINAKEKMYISWIGQDEKTTDELEPSSIVITLLRNLKEQYGINEDKIITRHPLQPFSKKYFNGELETYDSRWITPEKHENSVFFGSNKWKWHITKKENENKKRDVNFLINIFNDTPKYFFNEICNIYLPKKSDILDNLEPLIIEKGLENWKLANLIINNDDYVNKIEISKLRGELPDGKFANVLINGIIKDTKELMEKARNEENPYWIFPSRDKGKYRLRHWLYHLDLNANKKECQNTKMYLKDIDVIELNGMSNDTAKEILDELWELAGKLEKRLLPVFPDPAWIYLDKKDMKKVNKNIFDYGDYSHSIIYDSEYLKIVLKSARSLDELCENLEDEFIECSEILFKGYENYIVKIKEDVNE